MKIIVKGRKETKLEDYETGYFVLPDNNNVVYSVQRGFSKKKGQQKQVSCICDSYIGVINIPIDSEIVPVEIEKIEFSTL